ncbi:MAG: PBP1A family penicillin-binding protein [Desulfobacteraceae bacterium]|nr:PBP1A family penicillin-binding protein [Desulfobacteraceae bacterium]
MVTRKSSAEITRRRGKKAAGGAFSKLLRGFFWTALVILILGAAAAAGLYAYFSKDLPQITSLKDYRPPIITTVFSDDNRKIGEFFKERRKVLPLQEMPEMLLHAFVAAEDSRFYKHRGIDLIGILRAFFKNLEAGAIVQGGSTITQQVTKSFFLSPERSYQRKVKEAILAYRIDSSFTKDEVLYLYLNQIYLGHGAYGVEAAAENYFGKPARELNLAECAILAGLPQAPSRYSPFRNREKAKERQIYVLNRMVAEGYITELQASEAINFPLDVKPRRNWYIEKVPVYTEHVRRYVEKKYGEEALLTGGLKIFTAVNIGMQKIAQAEITRGLSELDKRQGYRGPIVHLAPEAMAAFGAGLRDEQAEAPLEEGQTVRGVVIDVDDPGKRVTVRMGDEKGVIPLENMAWARKPNPDVPWYAGRIKRPGQALAVGDVIWVTLRAPRGRDGVWPLSLEQTPEAQAALLCIEAETGHVKAMVGGRDFAESQFNRAIQSRRQPGSAFKPVIYAAALDKGYTPATVLIDSPIVYQDAQRDFTWKPKNYGEKFHGPTLLREALAKSRNVVTIKILQDIGIDYAIAYARKLGIQSPLSRDLSLALGSSGVSLLEIVNAYSVFANLGYLLEPIFITKIVDRDGNVLEENRPLKAKVIDQDTAYIMTSLLESVVKGGTGKRVAALGRPVAGKTGTTNNLYDAWFVGYTPRYITGTWVGFDQGGSLGKLETGARAASPIWLGFMQKILADKPVRVFPVPDGVVFAKIDAQTGLLPIAESASTLFECFKEGTAPTAYTKRPGEVTEPEEFYKSGM